MKSRMLIVVFVYLTAAFAACTVAKMKAVSPEIVEDTASAVDAESFDVSIDADSTGADSSNDDAIVDTADHGNEVTQPDASSDEGPVPLDIQFDAPCQPECDGKVCGSDGCGGICGYCTYPEVCDATGQCVEVCEPDCKGKKCGPDGCGGDCGTCEQGFDCGDDGLCYENACVPDCGLSTCGPDGCGGDCGVCAEPKICGDFEGCGGLCCALGPCGTVDETGECQGDIFVTCVDKVNLVETNCAEQKGFTCLYDPLKGSYGCAEEPECAPKCNGKECGADGCGGVCGVCTSGWSCELGGCKKEVGASCGTVTAVGVCEDQLYWYCSNGILVYDDCSLFGQTCGFIPADGSFGCK